MIKEIRIMDDFEYGEVVWRWCCNDGLQEAERAREGGEDMSKHCLPVLLSTPGVIDDLSTGAILTSVKDGERIALVVDIGDDGLVVVKAKKKYLGSCGAEWIGKKWFKLEVIKSVDRGKWIVRIWGSGMEML